MKSTALPFCIFLMLSCTAPTSESMAQSSEDVFISSQNVNRLVLETSGQPVVSAQSANALDKSATGSERSQCYPADYGRRSHAAGSVRVDTASSDATHLSATFKLAAVATGGHYRTCVA